MKEKRIPPAAAGEAQAEAFRALAHATRLGLFFRLVRAGRPVAAGDLAREAGIPGPTLTHHLDRLRGCGLVRRVRRSRHVLYDVDREKVLELVRLLTACC